MKAVYIFSTLDESIIVFESLIDARNSIHDSNPGKFLIHESAIDELVVVRKNNEEHQVGSIVKVPVRRKSIKLKIN